MVSSECSEQGRFQLAHWLLISAELSIVIVLLWVRQHSIVSWCFCSNEWTETAEESPHRTARSFTGTLRSHSWSSSKEIMSWTLGVVQTVELMRIKLDHNMNTVSLTQSIISFFLLAPLVKKKKKKFLSSLLLHTVSVPNMKKGRQRKLEPITFWGQVVSRGTKRFLNN